MELRLTTEMRDALLQAGHVPDDIKGRFAAIKAVPGSNPPSYALTLSEDEAMELSELLQWHVRSDAESGQPTPETAPYAAVIQAISDRQF